MKLPNNGALVQKLNVPPPGCRDGLAVKSTGCSFRGLEFNSQQLRGGFQTSIIGSNVLFQLVGMYTDRALIYLKYINTN